MVVESLGRGRGRGRGQGEDVDTEIRVHVIMLIVVEIIIHMKSAGTSLINRSGLRLLTLRLRLIAATSRCYFYL